MRFNLLDTTTWGWNNKLPSREEVKVERIIDKYLKRGSTVEFVPSHDEIVITDEEHRICISIKDNIIDMSNHDYKFTEQFNMKFTDKIKKKIKQKVENEILERKKQIFDNKINLLEKILEL